MTNKEFFTHKQNLYDFQLDLTQTLGTLITKASKSTDPNTKVDEFLAPFTKAIDKIREVQYFLRQIEQNEGMYTDVITSEKDTPTKGEPFAAYNSEIGSWVQAVMVTQRRPGESVNGKKVFVTYHNGSGKWVHAISVDSKKEPLKIATAKLLNQFVLETGFNFFTPSGVMVSSECLIPEDCSNPFYLGYSLSTLSWAGTKIINDSRNSVEVVFNQWYTSNSATGAQLLGFWDALHIEFIYDDKVNNHRNWHLLNDTKYNLDRMNFAVEGVGYTRNGKTFREVFQDWKRKGKSK